MKRYVCLECGVEVAPFRGPGGEHGAYPCQLHPESAVVELTVYEAEALRRLRQWVRLHGLPVDLKRVAEELSVEREYRFLVGMREHWQRWFRDCKPDRSRRSGLANALYRRCAHGR